MLEKETCPDCKTVVEVKDYNDGKCPKCGLVYSWQPVGIENAEHQDGPHDFVTWGAKHTELKQP